MSKEHCRRGNQAGSPLHEQASRQQNTIARNSHYRRHSEPMAQSQFHPLLSNVAPSSLSTHNRATPSRPMRLNPIRRSILADSSSHSHSTSSFHHFDSFLLGGASACNVPLGSAWFDQLTTDPEDDDWLHDPLAKDRPPNLTLYARARYSVVPRWMSRRALVDFGTFVVLCLVLLGVFAAYPISAAFVGPASKAGAFGLGGTNLTGQVPEWGVAHLRTGLIDVDTPKSAYYRWGVNNPKKRYRLVFSDEFSTDGRSFYPGDDPFWEAVDLNYWGTHNFEWYDPSAVTTSGGAMHITLSEHVSHKLNFRSGMVQTWNKFCFTGGLVTVAIRLPGSATVGGTWPAAWAMGNLGRAGYGASLEGLWPYSYSDKCDVGTLPNQTTWNGLPTAVQTGGSVGFNKKHGANVLSFLPGQRLSRCTCSQDDHPGPKLKDGTFKGRAAPEIDIFEAQVSSERMELSQSAQFAPFNQYYKPTNRSGPAYQFFQSGHINGYTGEVTQQAMSGIIPAVQKAVERGGDGSFAEYGFDYSPGPQGSVTWIVGGKPSWRLNPAALEPDPVTGISRRTVSEEPMYLILNLGMSEGFGHIDWDEMEFPYRMSIDWVRVYQPEDQQNVGCDPPDYPTKDYIQRHLEAYTNANLTLWGSSREHGGYGQVWPRNSLQPRGCSAPLSKFPGSPSHPNPRAPARDKHVAANWNKG